jgi:hypothetical protein
VRKTFAAMLLIAFAVPVHAGTDATNAPRPPRAETAPKADLDRPAQSPKAVDGKALCTYVNADQNAPSERGDCIAEREPMPQRPTEKTPPGPPSNDATPSSR